MSPAIIFRPQPGPQEAFLACPADITFYGGSAYGGKTWALVYSPLRHVLTPGFTAVIFRNTREEIRKSGGLWDESMNVYPLRGGFARGGALDWSFGTGSTPARIQFDGIQYESDLEKWRGAQICFMGFDQVETISRKKFFYLLSRNRSQCGVRPYVQATCNPDPDSWVASFIAWWIDQDTGIPIAARSGVLRWFVNIQDVIHWADTPADLIAQFGNPSLPLDHPDQVRPMSFTFIPASPYDNKIGLQKDPTYIAKLRALPLVDQERLLNGNWKIRPAAGLLFQRAWCPVFDRVPDDVVSWIRRWDLAGTPKTENNDPDWTVGVKLGRRPAGEKPRYVIAEVVRLREGPDMVKRVIRNCAAADGRACKVIIPQDPGQAGKFQAQDFALSLDGHSVEAQRETGDKVTRFGPFSSAARMGNVGYVKGLWNEPYLLSLEGFPDLVHDDDADATSGAYMGFVDTTTGLLDYYAEQAAALKREQK